MNTRWLSLVSFACLIAVVVCGLHLPPTVLAGLARTDPAIPVADPPVPPVNPQDPIFDVVGGTTAPPGAWPWLVALIFANEPDSYFGQFCGGSLITPEWVLTAAHCVTDFSGAVTPPEGIDILLGRQDLSSSGGERVDVVEIVRFPSYDDTGWLARDYALIRLATPSERQTIKVAGLEDSALFTPGTLAAVAGWGALSFGGGYPDAVRQAVVPIVPNDLCRQSYGSTINASHLCAGYIEQGGIDTCQGDSGGPLMVSDGEGGWLLAAITSTGEGCAYPNFPGVYARVAPFKSWIDAVINQQPYLTIVKTGPSVAAPEEPFTYTLRLDNGGATNLTNLVITDVVPLGAIVGDINEGGTLNGNVITWNAASLPVSDTLELTYTVSATATIENSLYGASSAEGVTATGLFPVRTVIDAPLLSVFIEPSNDREDSVFQVGREFTYTLFLYNDGLGPNATANNIMLRDVLPEGVEYVRGGIFQNGIVSWEVPPLPSGEVITREVVVRPLAFGTIFNNFYSVSYGDEQTQAGFYSSRINVSGVDLALTLDGPSSVSSGQPITYTLTISNQGDLRATDLVISYTLPAGASYIQSTSDGKLENGVVTWTRNRLLAGSAATYQVAITSTNTIVNTTYSARAEDVDGYEYQVRGTQVLTTTTMRSLFLPIVRSP